MEMDPRVVNKRRRAPFDLDACLCRMSLASDLMEMNG